jgi:protein O-mannosyl-transferase
MHSPKKRPRLPTEVDKTPARQAWGPALLMGLGLWLAVLATFWPALNNDFINYDDPDYVTLNPQVQQGLTGPAVRWAFTSTRQTANWHPVTWLSHMWDCQQYGPNARGHHRTSVLLHAFNAALLFWLLNRLTGARWRSLAVAALFGLHPLRVESVAWVAERKDVLSALFFMLTLLAYARFAMTKEQPSAAEKRPQASGSLRAPYSIFRPPPSFYYALALALFALGLMSKPMLVTLPFVLLLLDYWPLNRLRSAECQVRHAAQGTANHASCSTLHAPRSTFRSLLGLLPEKVPFLLLSAGSCVATLLVQHSGGAIQAHHSLALRVQTALVSYARYLGKLFWPMGLSIHYPYPDHWSVTTVLGSAALFGTLSWLALRVRRRHPYLLTGWFWYVGMLVPVIGLVQVGLQSMADRYTYLPGIGMLMVIVWGAHDLTRSWRRSPVVLGGGLCLVLVACAGITRRQIGFWKDSGALFEHALEVTRNNNLALMHLGFCYREQGRLPEAIEAYRRALAMDPRAEEPQLNLGVLLYTSGRQQEGIQQLEAAAQMLPHSSLVHGNLGVFLLSQGRLDEAARHLDAALRLNPVYVEAHVARGDVFEKQGQREAAIGHYREALRLRPGFAPAERRLHSLGAL